MIHDLVHNEVIWEVVGTTAAIMVVCWGTIYLCLSRFIEDTTYDW